MTLHDAGESVAATWEQGPRIHVDVLAALLTGPYAWSTVGELVERLPDRNVGSVRRAVCELVAAGSLARWDVREWRFVTLTALQASRLGWMIVETEVDQAPRWEREDNPMPRQRTLRRNMPRWLEALSPSPPEPDEPALDGGLGVQDPTPSRPEPPCLAGLPAGRHGRQAKPDPDIDRLAQRLAQGLGATLIGKPARDSGSKGLRGGR